jgi:hypothetical protein
MSKMGPAFFAVAATPPVVTWNPADKHADIGLSGGNMIATKIANDANRSVRATHGKPHTGTGYYEVVLSGGGISVFCLVGLSTASMPVAFAPGQDANSWGYYQQTGEKYTNNVLTAYGAGYASGDVISVAFSNGKVWFARNNVYQGSGNPAAGTGEAFSGIAGTIFPTVSIYRALAPAHTATGRFRLLDFTYSPPAGFSAWE